MVYGLEKKETCCKVFISSVAKNLYWIHIQLIQRTFSFVNVCTSSFTEPANVTEQKDHILNVYRNNLVMMSDYVCILPVTSACDLYRNKGEQALMPCDFVLH